MTSLEIPTHPIADFLAGVCLGRRQAQKQLTLWPLEVCGSAGPAAAPAYVSLGAALGAGSLRIDEVHEGGAVPHVRVSNAGDVAVLVLFGEEIRGAKQSRVANASFLVPARSDVVIDVSCVEAGRWHRRPGERFRAADSVISSSLRRKIARKVEHSRARGLSFAADQGEVWNEIGVRLERSGAASRTSAYADYRQSRATDLGELVRGFHPVDGQVGFVAAIGDEVAGVEAVGRPDVFLAEFQALLHAYAIDAIDAALVRDLEGRRSDAPYFEDPAAFLEALAGARITSTPSLGLGRDLRLRGVCVAGCALTCEGLVHLTAFPERA